MSQVDATSTPRWSVDTTSWLPPQFSRSFDSDAKVIEGTTGAVAALLYGVLEVRMCYEVAHLAILSGDPRQPEVLFRPADFHCEAAGVRWYADDRFLVVRAPISNKKWWRTHYAVPLCVFDLPSRTFTFIPLSNTYFVQLARSNDGWTLEESANRPASVPSHAGERFRDAELRWAPWGELAWASARFFAGWFGAVR